MKISMRGLTRRHLVWLGVDSTLGLGVYLFPGELAGILGGFSPLAILLAGALLSVNAMAFARLASSTSRNGGLYVYASRAFGPETAFFIGWTDFLGAALGAGAIAGYLAQTLSAAFAGPPWAFSMVAVVLLLGLAVGNYRGLMPGTRLMIFCTLLKLVPLIAIVLGSIVAIDIPAFASNRADLQWSQVSRAGMLILFMCQGFEMVPAVAGEAGAPRRNVPRAVLTSLWICVSFYALLQLGILGGPIRSGFSPLVLQGEHLWGKTGMFLMQLGSLFALVSLMAGRALAVPRLITPLAEDGLVSNWMAKLHPKYGSPYRAIIVGTLLSMGASLTQHLQTFIEISALGIALQYFLAGLCLLRKEYRLLANAVPLAIGSIAISLLFLFQTTRVAWEFVIAMYAVGLSIRVIQRRGRRFVPKIENAVELESQGSSLAPAR